jgi:superfamily II DNA or RNA helicase
LGFKLREYQIECVKTIQQSTEKFNLIMSSVGSGKTIVFATIAAEAKGRVLIVVPSTELREQAEEKLREIDPFMHIGSVQADLDDVEAQIVVSSRQSLAHKKSTRLQRMLEHGDFEYLIFDECHIAPESLLKIIKKINPNIRIFGFTATPYTKQCRQIFGEPIFVRSIMNMIDMGFLVEPYAISVHSKTNISAVKTVHGDFASGELETAVNNSDRNQLIVGAYKQFASMRKKTLLFAAGCDHGKELLRLFSAEGITCDYIDGNTDKEIRRNIVAKFRSGEIPLLINVLTLTTGFDVPDTDTIMICRPSKSRILFEQILGRGLRLADGKTDCLLIDIIDIVKTHDLMDISAVFDVKMKDGETPKQAFDRKEQERLAEEAKKLLEAALKEEQERKKKEEIELYFERIKLFNRDMTKRFGEAKYDWFRVDNLTYALSYELSAHYVVHNAGDNYSVYKVCTDRNYQSAVLEFATRDILEAIQYSEKRTGRSSYAERGSAWKLMPATDKQKQYYNAAVTKYDAHKYFSSLGISTAIKKIKRDVELNKILTS